MDRDRLDLATFAAELRRRLPLLLLIAVAAAALAYGLSLLQDKRYEATANLLFDERSSSAPERGAATNLALASLDTVVIRVRRRLRLDLTNDELRDRVRLSPRGQADIVEVEASGSTRQRAVDLANAFADEIVAFRREAAQREVQERIDALRERLAAVAPRSDRRRRLARRIRVEEIEQVTARGEVTIADRAVPPDEAAAPRPGRNAAIAGALALLLGVLATVLLRAVDRRLDEDDLASTFAVPVLGRVPRLGRAKWRQQLFREAFQFLRANLVAALGLRRRDLSHAGVVVVVTSPLPGAGKSTVTAELGSALGRGGERVLLVDLDVRRPTLAGQLGLKPEHSGVADVLWGDVDVDDAIRTTRHPGVSLLAGGSAGLDVATAQAGAAHLDALLDRLRVHADVILVDTAPVAIASETSVLAAAADHVLVVVDERTTRDVAVAARDQLRRVSAPVLGLVVNRADAEQDKSMKSAYGAYRGGGAERKKQPQVAQS